MEGERERESHAALGYVLACNVTRSFTARLTSVWTADYVRSVRRVYVRF